MNITIRDHEGSDIALLPDFALAASWLRRWGKPGDTITVDQTQAVDADTKTLTWIGGFSFRLDCTCGHGTVTLDDREWTEAVVGSIAMTMPAYLNAAAALDW